MRYPDDGDCLQQPVKGLAILYGSDGWCLSERGGNFEDSDPKSWMVGFNEEIYWLGLINSVRWYGHTFRRDGGHLE